VWDGWDASKLVRLIEHPQASIILQAFAMPDNTIIVRAPSVPADTSRADERRYPPLDHPDASYVHARHPRAICHDVAFRVEFPEATRRTPAGEPILSGQVPVRVTIDGRDEQHLVNQRFEVMLYEDLLALFEEEEAVNPSTFVWDTSRLPPGRHLFTVNILSYDDHYGVVTQPVMIEPGT